MDVVFLFQFADDTVMYFVYFTSSTLVFFLGAEAFPKVSVPEFLERRTIIILSQWYTVEDVPYIAEFFYKDSHSREIL